MLLLRLGMAIKGIDALIEVVVGFLLFTPMKLGDLVDRFCRAEMFDHFKAERAAGVLQHHAANAIHHSTTGTALYLVIHGIVKIVFITGAFWQKAWGYIGLTTILLIFVVIEIFQLIVKGGVFMLSMAVFDGFLAFLVWHEYRKQRPDPQALDEKSEVKYEGEAAVR